MIKLKLEQLVNSTDVLQKLSKAQLKARTALSIARLLKEAERELGVFNETRMSLITEYGEKDENNNLITDADGNCKIPNETLAEFSKELQELINTEVEINASKINLSDIDSIDFTPSEITALEAFIEEE